MNLQGYEILDGLLYTKEHEWAKEEGASIRIGVTDYAAKTLNDVVYVTSPKVGSKVEQMKSLGTVESIKAVSEIYSPVSGVVSKVNSELDSHPELINKSPYGEGWIILVEPSNFSAEKKSLLDSKAYAAFLGTIMK
jgi:glycine cleavage system H protein